MSHSPFYDRRAATLLSRVSDDLSNLRSDVASLLSHTTRRTIPKGARELTDSARHGIAAGGAYAASHLRSLRGGHEPSRSTTGWIGGAVLLGVLAASAYAMLQHRDSASFMFRGNDSDDLRS